MEKIIEKVKKEIENYKEWEEKIWAEKSRINILLKGKRDKVKELKEKYLKLQEEIRERGKEILIEAGFKIKTQEYTYEYINPVSEKERLGTGQREIIIDKDGKETIYQLFLNFEMNGKRFGENPRHPYPWGRLYSEYKEKVEEIEKEIEKADKEMKEAEKELEPKLEKLRKEKYIIQDPEIRRVFNLRTNEVFYHVYYEADPYNGYFGGMGLDERRFLELALKYPQIIEMGLKL